MAIRVAINGFKNMNVHLTNLYEWTMKNRNITISILILDNTYFIIKPSFFMSRL